MPAVQRLEVERISCLEVENLSASEKAVRYHVHESPSTGDQDHDRQQGWLSSKVEPSLLLIHTQGNSSRVYGLESAVWNFHKTKKRGMEIGKLIHSFHQYILRFYYMMKTEFTEWGRPAASSQQAQVQNLIWSRHLCNSEKGTWGWPARMEQPGVTSLEPRTSSTVCKPSKSTEPHVGLMLHLSLSCNHFPPLPHETNSQSHPFIFNHSSKTGILKYFRKKKRQFELSGTVPYSSCQVCPKSTAGSSISKSMNQGFNYTFIWKEKRWLHFCPLLCLQEPQRDFDWAWVPAVECETAKCKHVSGNSFASVQGHFCI